jgi:MFS transporter, ACS family, allantoate permease
LEDLEPTLTITTGPQIIEGFGFGPDKATLLSMAPGAGIVVGTGLALIIARLTNRTISGIFVVVLSVIGCIMMFAVPADHYAARYGGYILTLQCK